MPDLHMDESEHEYEPPAIVPLGSVDELTRIQTGTTDGGSIAGDG